MSLAGTDLLSLSGLGDVAAAQGDYARATALLEDSLAAARKLRFKEFIARSLSGLGDVAAAQGDYARAIARYEECLVL